MNVCHLLLLPSAHGSDGTIVFIIVAFSVSTTAHEPMHLAWWNFAWICTLTTSRSLLNIKVIGHRSKIKVTWVCVLLCAWCCGYPRAVLSLEQGLTVLFGITSSCRIGRSVQFYHFTLGGEFAVRVIIKDRTTPTQLRRYTTLRYINVSFSIIMENDRYLIKVIWAYEILMAYFLSIRSVFVCGKANMEISRRRYFVIVLRMMMMMMMMMMLNEWTLTWHKS